MEMIKKIKKVYTKNYLILIGIGLLPLFWKILEFALLSNFNNAIKILAQISLISIIFKIFEESILNPLYSQLSKQNFENQEEKNFVAKKFLIIYSVVTFIFVIILIALSLFILKASQVPAEIFKETLTFIRIYIVSCGVGIISKYLYTYSIISKTTKKIAIYLLIKSIATAILFTILVPKFSFGLGVNGIAIAELLINIATVIYLCPNLIETNKFNIKINLKEYLKLLIYSFIETLIRNIVYYFVILVFLNMINNQDLYFVANDYIWSIMLVPTLAQSLLIKQEIANGNYDLTPYFLNCIISILFILALIPLALFVFKYLYNLNNYLEYFVVLIKLVPCYFIFIFDSVIEAYFISCGKLHHILIQSILTNIFVYLTAFILYLCGAINITLNLIILLFNIGVIVSSIYTISIYFVENKKNT